MEKSSDLITRVHIENDLPKVSSVVAVLRSVEKLVYIYSRTAQGSIPRAAVLRYFCFDCTVKVA